MHLSTLLTLLLIVLPLAPCEAADATLSPEQKAVRAHLEENLASGAFEELKWFPGKSSKGGLLWDADDGGKLSRMHHDLFRMAAVNGTAVRLKYRTKNKLGAEVWNDKTFFIVGGRVVGRCDTIDFRFAGESTEAWGKRTGNLQSPAAENTDQVTGGLAGRDNTYKPKVTSKKTTRDLRR